jgi:hypothetical protein
MEVNILANLRKGAVGIIRNKADDLAYFRRHIGDVVDAAHGYLNSRNIVRSRLFMQGVFDFSNSHRCIENYEREFWPAHTEYWIGPTQSTHTTITFRNLADSGAYIREFYPYVFSTAPGDSVTRWRRYSTQSFIGGNYSLMQVSPPNNRTVTRTRVLSNSEYAVSAVIGCPYLY